MMAFGFRLKYLVAALAVVILAVGRAEAQPDPNLKPTYGSTTLNSGFLPDPFTKPLIAGGPIRTNLGGVNAHVAKAPDFSLHYTKGNFPLSFHVKSAGDTTLLINLPDGTWIADDDGGGGLDPLIRIARPQSGRYDIYVGTYRKDFVEATLYISERTPGVAKKPPPPVNPNAPDCYLLSVGVDNYPFVNKLQGDLNDAKNTVAAFKSQAGTRFRSVKEHMLLDGAATHQAILQGLQSFTRQGAAHDFMVLFMSGHGGRANGNNTWYFLPFDFHPQKYASTALTDKQILDIADQLVRQKKNVVIIVDACHCGQMHTTAQPYLRNYQTPNEGGLILMLACTGDQTSAALGNYSTFAKAFADCMTGAGDLSRNGIITIGEVQDYTRQRTNELVSGARMPKQDSIVAWSPSISRKMPFAHAGKAPLEIAKLPASGSSTHWVGSETLPGYGKLSFTMYANGKAVMADAKSTTEGIWQRQNNQITLSYANGAIVYSGTLNGNVLSGTATSPGTREKGIRSWTWTVQR